LDPGRLGLLGVSFGGAHVLVAAAHDARVRAVVAIAPVTDGARWLRSLRREWEWREFQLRLAADRTSRVVTGASEVVPFSDVVALDPETETVLQLLATARPDLEWTPPLSLESAEMIVDYQPEALVGRIAPRPLLLIHGREDVLVPPEESLHAFKRAGDPKRLELLPGVGHFNWQRADSALFSQVTGVALDWLRVHLTGSS
jgi:pimeloyl-ACP methyl ester carboxylesterase